MYHGIFQEKKMIGVQKKAIVYLLFSFFILASPCCAQEISDAEFISLGDVARYNSIVFDDDVVAWLEYDLDENDLLASSIHRYNISTGMQELVVADPSGKFSLDFSGDRYVWSDQRGIFLYDESEGEITFFYSDNPQYSPVIDGDTIVWVEKYDDKRSKLMIYDIPSGDHYEMSGGMFDSYDYPAISGDWIAFIEEDTYEGTMKLCFTNLNEGTGYFSNADIPVVYQPPSIDGNRVVWTGMNDDGYYNTFIYEIGGGEPRVLAPSDSAQLCPDISGNHVVWLDLGPYPQNLPWGGDLFVHDLDSGTTVEISPETDQEFPKVSGDYVVWLNAWGDDHEIYLHSFLDDGRDFLSDDEDGIEDATPTPLPTPGTKVRFYSKIQAGGTDWYSLVPSKDTTQLSFELRWTDPDAELSLSVVSPSGNIWLFSDGDDSNDDCAVRMTISNIYSGVQDCGRWTVAVTGKEIAGEVDYDICWY